MDILQEISDLLDKEQSVCSYCRRKIEPCVPELVIGPNRFSWTHTNGGGDPWCAGGNDYIANPAQMVYIYRIRELLDSGGV